MCNCAICGKLEFNNHLIEKLIIDNKVYVCLWCEGFIDDLQENQNILKHITIKQNTSIIVTKEYRKLLYKTFEDIIEKYSIHLKNELLPLEGKYLIEKILDESKRNNWDKNMGLNTWSLNYYKRKLNSTKGLSSKELKQMFYIIKQFESLFECVIYKVLKIK